MDKKVYDYTQVLMAYHSEKMEGCASSFDEVKEIYKHPKDCEVSRHFKLFDHMLETYAEALSEELIFTYHAIMAEGKYRTTDSTLDKVRGATLARKIPTEMRNLIATYEKYESREFLHIVDFIACFDKIHPFDSQCGCVGRMLVFKECLRNNFTPIIFYTGRKANAISHALAVYDEDPHFLIELMRKMRTRYKHETEAL